MIHIARDMPLQSTQSYRYAIEDVEECLAFLRSRARDVDAMRRHLQGLADASLRVAVYASSIEPESTALCNGLKIAGRCRAAIFALASASAETLTLPIDDGEPIAIPSFADRDDLSASNWALSFYLCAATRDFDSLNRLISIDFRLFETSSVQSDEWVTKLNVALAKHFKSDPATLDAIVDALEATDETRVRVTSFDDALYSGVPKLDMLQALHQRDEDHFNDAFRKALECHKKSHSATDYHALLALGPLGLASLARMRGLEICVTSEYTPQRVIDGECCVAPKG